jgi:hypothetical protein
VVIALGAFGIMALGPRNAAAEDTYVFLDPPIIIAGANDGQTVDFKLRDSNDITDAGLIEAEAAVGGGLASARVGLLDVLTARSRGEGTAGGADVYTEFTVEDPQNRPEVKTIFHFSAVAATRADPPDSNSGKGAQWSVYLGPMDGAPWILTVRDDLSSNITTAPQFVGPYTLRMQVLAESGNGGFCERYIAMNDVNVTNEWLPGCTNAGIGGTIELTHAPGRYLMRTNATAVNYGFVIGDPVWQPHPDYPDVVITRDSPPGVPPAPLGDTTPEELAAEGIDPTLFVEAGFFDDPTPPTPTSTPARTATPAPSATATPVPGATATPASGGSKKCDAGGADAAAIAAARARIDVDCPCDDYDGSKGRKHGDYVRCATATVKALVRDSQLKKSCKKATRKCSAGSTCGSPGFVACRLTSARDQATCAIKASPARCVAPRGGGAEVVGAATSCCDVAGLR